MGHYTSHVIKYRKVVSSSLSQLVALFQIFKRLMRGKFDAYVLEPLSKKFQIWIVDWSITPNFTVHIFLHNKTQFLHFSSKYVSFKIKSLFITIICMISLFNRQLTMCQIKRPNVFCYRPLKDMFWTHPLMNINIKFGFNG